MIDSSYNPFDSGKALKSQAVVCAMLEAGNVKFFSSLAGNRFTLNPAMAQLAKKSDLFDIVCQLPEWDEICGTCVFLNVSELQEILQDNEAYKKSQQAA